MPSVDVRTGAGGNAHWGHVFQGQNTTWLFAVEIRYGNFFNGLQGSCMHIFDAQIPPGSIIESATQEVTARLTLAGAMTSPISTPERDTYSTSPLLMPFVPHAGVRRDFWSNSAMGALSTTFTAIAGSATAPSNASWIMRQIGNWRDRLVQFTPTRTGNMTLATGIWEMHRTGNPLGSCRMRIQGIQFDSYGSPQPDGVDVAVSSDVLCSSIALGPAASVVGFAFPGGETLVALTDYAWILEVDYVADNANHVSGHHHNAFFNNGQLYHEGIDTAGVWQNYPGTVDWTLAQGTDLAPAVNWVVPNMTAGLIYASPDISSIIQAQVNAPWYTQDSGIIISHKQPGSGLVGRQWRSASNVANLRPRLQAVWRERRIHLT